MALDTAKLENVVKKPNGMFTARCPACSEEGADSKGEHLAVFPDGRFGCVVSPKDKEHNKRIYALAGDGEDGTIDLEQLKGLPADIFIEHLHTEAYDHPFAFVKAIAAPGTFYFGSEEKAA